jgi:hypothetical protein
VDDSLRQRNYRLLLEVAEAANSQLDLDGLLEAVAGALKPTVRVDAVSVVIPCENGDNVRLLALYATHLRKPGESLGRALNRLLALRPENLEDVPEFPFENSPIGHVHDTRAGLLCADIANDFPFPDPYHLAANGIRSPPRCLTRMTCTCWRSCRSRLPARSPTRLPFGRSCDCAR